METLSGVKVTFLVYPIPLLALNERIPIDMVLKEYPYYLSIDTFIKLVKLGPQVPWIVSGGRLIHLEGD